MTVYVNIDLTYKWEEFAGGGPQAQPQSLLGHQVWLGMSPQYYGNELNLIYISYLGPPFRTENPQDVSHTHQVIDTNGELHHFYLNVYATIINYSFQFVDVSDLDLLETENITFTNNGTTVFSRSVLGDAWLALNQPADWFTVNITSGDGTSTVILDVLENTENVTTVVATSDDVNTVSYSIIGGADEKEFLIDTNTGALVFKTASDFERPSDENDNNNYVVIVQASNGVAVDTQAVTVNVIDANDNAPTITTLGTQSLAENETVVAALTSTDLDTVGTSPAIFSIAGGADAAKFKIENGSLVFVTAPDFEKPTDADSDNIYVVEVQASDGELESKLSVRVTVANKNESLFTELADNVDLNKVTVQAPDTNLYQALGGNDIVTLPASEAERSAISYLTTAWFCGMGGNDTINGGSLKDQIDGGANNDKLIGGSNDDVIRGGLGDESLDGGIGNDVIYGTQKSKESDNNTVNGGDDADEIHYNQNPNDYTFKIPVIKNALLRLSGKGDYAFSIEIDDDHEDFFPEDHGIEKFVFDVAHSKVVILNSRDISNLAGIWFVKETLVWVLRAGVASSFISGNFVSIPPLLRAINLVQTAELVAKSLITLQHADSFISYGIDSLVSNVVGYTLHKMGVEGIERKYITDLFSSRMDDLKADLKKLVLDVSHKIEHKHLIGLEAGSPIGLSSLEKASLVTDVAELRDARVQAFLGKEFGSNPDWSTSDRVLVPVAAFSGWATQSAPGMVFGALANTITKPLNDLGIYNLGGGSDKFGIKVEGYTRSLSVDGEDGNDTIAGGLSDDFLSGGAGADRLVGGQGSDNLDGGAGIDSMAGGVGDDFYVVDSAKDAIVERQGEGNDTLEAQSNYVLRPGVSIENLRAVSGIKGISISGNELANRIEGNQGTNQLAGGDGNDILLGNDGPDRLLGNAGADTLRGESGDDSLDGGAGKDILFGGVGADTFVFKKGGDVDIIMDYNRAADLIDLRAFGFDNFAAVKAVSHNTAAGDLELDLVSGQTLFIHHFKLANLDAGDVLV